MKNDADKQEICLLAHYGGDGPEKDVFQRECESARARLVEGPGISAVIAEEEVAVNRRLNRLRIGFADADPFGAGMKDEAFWLYREKIIRNLRVAAMLEAITGRDCQFFFVGQYARYIYPKLLNRVQASINC